LSTLKVEGQVLSLDARAGRAEVQIGRLRTRAGLDELEWRESQRPAPERDLSRSARKKSTKSASVGIELDLRGERVEGALQRLDSFLDSAVLGNAPWVRIIHGKGTGRLRTAVRQALKEHAQVRRFADGKDGEGGWGVTVAHFSD
jgi:DNA mismatch repair protein MutS2